MLTTLNVDLFTQLAVYYLYIVQILHKFLGLGPGNFCDDIGFQRLIILEIPLSRRHRRDRLLTWNKIGLEWKWRLLFICTCSRLYTFIILSFIIIIHDYMYYKNLVWFDVYLGWPLFYWKQGVENVECSNCLRIYLNNKNTKNRTVFFKIVDMLEPAHLFSLRVKLII